MAELTDPFALPTFEELYAAVEALPPGLTGELLAPGFLRVMGRPGRAHRVANRRIVRALGASDLMEGGVGWWFEVEAEIRFGERLFVPDGAGWRVAHIPAFTEENPITVAPDWACDVLSRGTQRGDRAEKLRIYAASGVGHAWVVDPKARTVEVHVLHGGRYELAATAAGDQTVVLAPFDEPIRLRAWWSASPV